MGFVKNVAYLGALLAVVLPLALRYITRIAVPSHMCEHPVVYEKELIGEADRKSLANLVQEMGSKSFHTNAADVKSYKTLREHIGEVRAHCCYHV
jgi:hypothetical protein